MMVIPQIASIIPVGNPRQARPNGVVNVVDDRKDAPAAVNLRIVSGYFRCNQEDWGEKYRESNGCDERVCGAIDVLESLYGVYQYRYQSTLLEGI